MVVLAKCKVFWRSITAAIAILGVISALAGSAKQTVPNFRLLDHQGRSFELYRFKEFKAVVVMTTGVGCPIVRHSLVELKELRTRFRTNGVEFVLLDSNAGDTTEQIADEVREYSIDFTVLLDREQLVGRQLGATRTAEVYVIDPKDWTVAYRGPVDDRVDYGQQKPKAKKPYVANAVEAILSGGAPKVTSQTAKGCAIVYEGAFSKSAHPVSYAREVAPVISENCGGCHQKGGIAPFAFDGYERARNKSATMMEALLEKRMPPWQPNPDHGCFANDHSLAPEKKRILAAWVEQGCPRGDGGDPLAVRVSQPADDWPLGTPDVIVQMPRAMDLPATGLVPYQYLEVSAPVTDDTWVRGAVIRAGNSRVVHHCLVFIKYPEELRGQEPRQDGGTSGFFAGYVPGTQHVFFPNDTGKFVPKGSIFIFQMHYTTTGKPETDRTEMGLYTLPDQPKRELITGAVNNLDFRIPPGAFGHQVRAEVVAPKDSVLYDLSPHMHLRGYSFQYEAEYPDGRRELLLAVPRYDFNWQFQYRLKEPKHLPKGTKLICTGTYDNTAANPANPDPGVEVAVGEKTTDEMFIGYFNYAEVRPSSAN